MQPAFILSCESTIDLPYSYVQERELPVLFYSFSVDGEAHVDDMGRDPQSLPRFYQYIADGKLPSTSQLNEAQYEDFFAPLLEQAQVVLALPGIFLLQPGQDLLSRHLRFNSSSCSSDRSPNSSGS